LEGASFEKKKISNILLRRSNREFAENPNQKFWGVTTPAPLGKISSPRFQLILK